MKMVESKRTPFLEAVSYLPNYAAEFLKLPRGRCEAVREIRIREGKFIALELCNERVYLNIKPDKNELRELVSGFCNYSLHSFEKQIAEGFITLKGGHRAGFAGTAVLSGNRVENIRDITSINIRIAKEHTGSSDVLYEKLFGSDYNSFEKFRGLLIIGRPMSGKTTVLRDLIRNISERYKVSVIDERGEIAAKSSGEICFDLGPNTDVLDSFTKEHGISAAIRALSPDFIACDEIAGDDISSCVNSGVRLIMTAHSSSAEEAAKSEILGKIIDSGAISHVAQLGTGGNVGKLIGFWNLEKERFGKKYESFYSDSYSDSGSIDRIVPRIQTQSAGR